jgi:hypothetical protein
MLLIGGFFLGAASKVGGITLPPGFSDTAVAHVASPTPLAFTPDGRLLIAVQPGRLWVYQNGVLSPLDSSHLRRRTRERSRSQKNEISSEGPRFGFPGRPVPSAYNDLSDNVQVIANASRKLMAGTPPAVWRYWRSRKSWS